MFTINVGLYKECEFARSKHHQKFKIKICTWERTKILKSVLSGRIWDLIVSVPDHCLSFYLTEQPGAVARSEASSLGMQAAPSSIPTSGTFFRGDLVMKTFLRPFSLFR